MKYDCTRSRIYIFTGGTPTGVILDAVLNDHLNRIDRVASKPVEYEKIPPLDIIVLTDGVPSASISLIAGTGLTIFFSPCS